MLGQTLLSAIVLASVYALLAVGFVVIYRSSRILNFAYGDIVMLAGYFLVTMTTITIGPTPIAIFITLLLGFIIGVVIYALLISPMASQPAFSTIILTVCIGIVLRTVTILFWAGKVEIISLGWSSNYLIIGNVNISSNQILLIITNILVFIGLITFYRYSKIGQQMRATAESALLASQRGINIHFIMGIAWGLGFFFSTLAALFLGANYGVSLQMGHTAIKAFAVALVGGLDSVHGIIPAAFIIALSEVIACNYINPRLGDTIPFIIMLAILIVRPWGLFGTKEDIERI